MSLTPLCDTDRRQSRNGMMASGDSFIDFGCSMGPPGARIVDISRCSRFEYRPSGPYAVGYRLGEFFRSLISLLCRVGRG